MMLVKLDFFSPFVSKPAFLEHGAGPTLPPPTTLLGALGAVAVRPEERFYAPRADFVLFWAPPYTEGVGLYRHYTFMTQKPGRLKKLPKAIEAVLRGREDEVVESGMTARDLIQNFLGVGSRREVYFWAPAYLLVSGGEAEKLVPYIYRVGQKEGLVAATPLKFTAEDLGVMEVKTRFYIPAGWASECTAVPYYGQTTAQCREEFFFDPRLGLNAERQPFYVPPPMGYIRVRPAEGYTAVKIVPEVGEELYALLPKEYARS